MTTAKVVLVDLVAEVADEEPHADGRGEALDRSGVLDRPHRVFDRGQVAAELLGADDRQLLGTASGSGCPLLRLLLLLAGLVGLALPLARGVVVAHD
jgi:hypothetical protein